MKIIRSIRSMQRHARRAAAQGKTIALVPTMGCLHDGHLSLIRRARRQADLVIVSIFVNPAQFAPTEDLSRYPRNEKNDLAAMRASRADVAFIPRAEDIYPDGYQTYVEVEELSNVLEGASRPGHFRGVTTVVAKLFNLTRPDVVVFGQKDFQQSVVLRQMTRDLNYPVKFVVAPTVREKDGLAMSSRNTYFTASQREDALCLYDGLKAAKQSVGRGQKSTARIEKAVRKAILETFAGAEIGYIAFNRIDTLEPVKTVTRGTVCSLAVCVHGVRLIDNMKLA